ncbi:MAG: porin family protein [Muribaculaceae bacterium]|nr:porin family protein [Muribaculaceae bacterium]
MITRLRHILPLVLLVLATALPARSQTAPYKFDLGAQLGTSGYIGEANSTNIMKHPGFDGELSFRYIADVRWSFRGVFSVFGLSGDTSETGNILPDGKQYSFTSTVYDLGGRVEFNFLPYGIGETYKRLRRVTPYITLGVGVCMSSSGGEMSFAPTLPMGLGVKFKMSERWNLAAEFTMTKAFGDKVDGSSLTDLNGIKTAFYRNTDWYSRLTIGISYEFGKRCETCHYVE